MAAIQASSSLQVLQSIQDCIKKSESDLNLIPTPDLVYREHVTVVKTLLDEAFRRFRESESPMDQHKNDIIRFVGELKTLEIDRLRILANLAKVYESRAAAALQRMSNRLLPTMGPRLVKEALGNIVTEDLRNYIPQIASVIGSQSVTEAAFGRISPAFTRVGSMTKDRKPSKTPNQPCYHPIP